METPYSQLVFEYRLVLTIWNEAKDKYGFEDKETISAALRLEQLKNELDKRRLARAA
jgi:hypothetical protein